MDTSKNSRKSRRGKAKIKRLTAYELSEIIVLHSQIPEKKVRSCEKSFATFILKE